MPVRWIPGKMAFANAYVIDTILIDAGAIPMAVAPHRDRITTIVLTHCHYDHTAYLPEISKMCGATIAIHTLDAPALTDDLESVALMFGERAPPVRPDRLLSEGDTIGSLQVLHTPGHTRGSICLYDQVSGALFSGDTVFTEGSFGRYDLPGGSLEHLRQSISRLASLRVRSLYPGHGVPVEEGGDRHIEAARQMIVGMND